MNEGVEHSERISIQLPQPDEISERDREDAMGAYLMMFASVAVSMPLPIINLIAAIIYYYSNRKKSKFIHFHCHQSLVSQIPTTVSNWVLLFVSIRIWLVKDWSFNQNFWYLLAFVVLANLAYIVFSLIAAVSARKGKLYHFLIFGQFSSRVVFSRQTEIDYER